MSQTLRTFVGVSIPSSERIRGLLQTCREFGRAVRTASDENCHVTLQFIGPTPADKVAAVSECLQIAVREIRPFTTEICGLGAFPSLRRPSVVWAGFRDSAPWEHLANRIQRPLRALGFPRDRQRFHPHVTLARVRARPPAELQTWIEQEAATEFGSFEVRTVTLFQSDLDAAGARYTVLATAPLSGQQKDW